ncbi:DUF952 domain-containing protein [Zavarzinia compransoris]|uniref:DUF952 domain-containing protein n=1 Tax=Zavarzinia compransoris TaxID=1264899 RepID=A0A317DST2_9PROT|nr:DUF952 domain-containing protein [Zavarzinia compransoris]PWR17748.1 DUF952 domain-containing protein [Zavarzinia compransoris]TDP49273.1 uncharacterized protein (DUF952 family) [Zavarzinia compransoris]
MTGKTVYKIMDTAAWDEFQASGVFAGAPVDLADGFIHFSDAHQVQGTLDRHFAGRGDLVLVAVAADRLGPALVYEVSRGGDLFPHLYASLPRSAVVGAAALAIGAAGRQDSATAIARLSPAD